MDRRRLLGHLAQGLAGAAAYPLFEAQAADSRSAVRIHVDPGQKLGEIPASFMGLGYEISSAAIPGLLSARNATYVQLVRNLGPQGIIRIGGNTSDFSSFDPNGRPLAVPKGTVVNSANLKELGGFLDAVGWQLIWGLNLGEGTAEQAVEEARAVSAAAGARLLAFEIGNEPDLFKQAGHRTGQWGYDDWLAGYRRYKAAIRQALPDAKFAGPDVAGATGWVGQFVKDEGHDAVLLTHHYYIGGSNQPASTFEKMLTSDPRVANLGDAMRAAGKAAGLPYRICETNSFSGGGKGGVSDTIGSALWVLDFMFVLASKGCAGVNMETGVNHLGFISSYSPVAGDQTDNLSAAPEYYGLLAFARGGRGQLVSLDVGAGNLNLTAYGTQSGDRELLVTVINKEEKQGASVQLSCERPLRGGSVMRLNGLSSRATSGARFGGAMLDRAGRWMPHAAEKIAVTGGQAVLAVPAASAAVVTLAI